MIPVAAGQVQFPNHHGRPPLRSPRAQAVPPECLRATDVPGRFGALPGSGLSHLKFFAGQSSILRIGIISGKG